MQAMVSNSYTPSAELIGNTSIRIQWRHIATATCPMRSSNRPTQEPPPPRPQLIQSGFNLLWRKGGGDKGEPGFMRDIERAIGREEATVAKRLRTSTAAKAAVGA